MASVTARGTSRASLPPDRATIDLGITQVGLTASTALDVVAERSQRLAQQLSNLGFEDRDWSTQGVSIIEEWEWKDDTNTMVGHRATSGITVDVDDLDRVGPLLRIGVDEAGAQIRNLQWSVAPDNPARHALLGEAALDARRRADAYVTALGLQLGPVEEISDLPIGSPSPWPSAAADSKFRATLMTESGSSLPVNPGEIELTATVFVRFGTLTSTLAQQ